VAKITLSKQITHFSMKKIVSTVAFLLILSTNSALAASFKDIQQGHPNAVAINHLSDTGLIKGYSDGTFQSEKLVNRAEALKLILESVGVDTSEVPEESPFPDVPKDQWFANYVIQAQKLGIVSGNPDGSFAPSSNVKRAAFMKMLLETNRFKKEKWADQQYYNDIATNQWYAAYMNYAGKAGLIIADSKNNLLPDKDITRGEVAEILYLMKIILNGKNTQLLVSQGEAQMAQIEIYISEKKIMNAKRAAELANDMSQQALRNLPNDNIVLAAAKIAKSYQLLVDAFIAGIQKQNDSARELAEMAKVKATEGWEANNDIQPIAKHLKTRADEILAQLK